MKRSPKIISQHPPREWRWLRNVALFTIGVLGLIAAGWAIGLNIRSATQAGDKPASSDERISSGDLTDISTFPPFEPDIGMKELSRAANLNTLKPSRSRVDVLRYTVQPGDSVFGISGKFGIEPETLLWGNFEVLNDDPHLLKPGQELNILPVDGTYYEWQDGDDLDLVADFFGVEPDQIIEWPGNNISPADSQVLPGTWLIVPEGRRAFKQWFVPTIARGQAGVGAAYGPGGCTGTYTGVVGTGGFIWPASNHYISGNDYWSGHLAIDIAAGMGAGLWAADGGVVVFAGWSTVGYGNMVMIDHGNGWQTVYGHLSQVDVVCGQSLSQGQNIGLAGSTGNSTGPHLHFETRFQDGFVNPWYVLP
ncbi:MAG: M23 family metallopeptidase [Anaerolineales bacterium]|nr:M23 family metallopeptidase [Anaerolineales bacterium]